MIRSNFPFWDDCIEFCQALLRTPSLSGQEEDVANLVKQKMEDLSYDDVWVDEIGNVIGLLKGNNKRSSICFTAHMDTVDPGEEKYWEYPPYSGAIADGFIHGRGASDLKGPLATQIYIPDLVKFYGAEHGDIYVIQVVQEEVGGLGSTYLDDNLLNAIDFAINGEPTSNKIHIADKGRIEFKLFFKGISAHASEPELASNPIYDIAEFIIKLRDLKMRQDNFGQSTATPTICITQNVDSNTTPYGGIITIDWRTLPGETEDEVRSKVLSIAPKNAKIIVNENDYTTYTNQRRHIRRHRLPFFIDRYHPLVTESAEAVSSALKSPAQISQWVFCTDCGCFSKKGIPIVGFSPGDEKSIHTCRERINIELMREAMMCYPAIVSRVSCLPKRNKANKELTC